MVGRDEGVVFEVLGAGQRQVRVPELRVVVGRLLIWAEYLGLNAEEWV